MKIQELTNKLNEIMKEYGVEFDVKTDLECEDHSWIELNIKGIKIEEDAVLLEC